ncbi:glucans biosynthesis glucosyltransferase MdoH [Vibrio sp. WJH972]
MKPINNNTFNEVALPKESRLQMNRHQVSEAGTKLKRYKQTLLYSLWTLLSRLIVLGVTVGLSAYGITEMHGVLNTNKITNLQLLFLVLFSVNFIWVSFAFAQALLGFVIHLKPRIIKHQEVEPEFKTAILLPIYNENPIRIKSTIEAMKADLVEKSPGKYAFFILSDTNRSDAWIAEEEAFLDLMADRTEDCPVYYRRRHKNVERKAGNIGDWVQRWGGEYEAMIVLDADSIMSAESMITLSRRLAAAPNVGLIQTLPKLVFANTLYSRLQQFANQCFGPIYAEGLSAWHGLSSNFWGHNAIIRSRAFAEAAHLPILSGKAPFGGHVLSHDFIEAALMRRAGWGVRFDTDIECSFEEAPPSLSDVMVRDRRWCQGNLQHKAFIFAKGFCMPTRLHIFAGIMSYLSAIFWLALIIVGLAIAIQAKFIRPEYFSNPSLFPTWPIFDSERALSLFAISMLIVLAPKIFGWFAAMVNVRRCMQFGGPILLTLSTLFEVVMSALYAPILMVSQLGVVIGIFRGKDSGWKPQSRDDGAISWASARRGHTLHTLFGLALSAIAFTVSNALVFWILPITIGLVLSIPLSWISGGEKRTKYLKVLGLLRAPDEKRPAKILVELEKAMAKNPPLKEVHALNRLVKNESLYKWHKAQLPVLSDQPPEFDAARVLAEWKLRHASDLDQLDEWLESDEALALLNDRASIEQLDAVTR